MSTFEEYLDSLTQPSSRKEHFMAKITGEEELENEYLPSSREEGFAYKIARKVNSASGGGIVYATFTEDEGTWTCDKTYAELKAAYDAGNSIVAICGYGKCFMAHINGSEASFFSAMTITAMDASEGNLNEVELTGICILDNDLVGVQVGSASFVTNGEG